jgi:hypothetical protein
MCHFVTLTLPGSADLAALREAGAPYDLSLEPIHNSSLQPHLAAGHGYFIATAGMCDCGTPLGAAAREGKREKSARPRRRPPESSALSLANGGGNLSVWLQALRALLDSRAASRLGLLLH